MRGRLGTLASLLPLLALAACGGGGGGSVALPPQATPAVVPTAPTEAATSQPGLPATEVATTGAPATLPAPTDAVASAVTAPTTAAVAATSSAAPALPAALAAETRLATAAPTDPKLAAVVDGWRGSWASLLIATQHRSAKDPLLATYNTGQQLTLVQGLAQKNISAGYALTGYVLLSPAGVTVSSVGSFALLQDCVDLTHVVYNLKGKPTSFQQKPSRFLYQVRLTQGKNGAWAVSATSTTNPPTCT